MQFLDIITIMTVAGILAILVLYVVVVYKKGWLKKDLRGDEAYFLCPNSKCHRVFKDPVWLTDLSRTPPESYQACPHCSTNLQFSPSFSSAEESTQTVSKPRASPIIKDVKKPSERAPSIQKENMPERKGIMRGIFKHTPRTSIAKKPEKSAGFHEPKLLVQAPPKRAETPKKPVEEKVSERPRACPHHFGYVKTLPKNTSIPDECLWCPWIVDCLAGTHKVEA